MQIRTIIPELTVTDIVPWLSRARRRKVCRFRWFDPATHDCRTVNNCTVRAVEVNSKFWPISATNSESTLVEHVPDISHWAICKWRLPTYFLGWLIYDNQQPYWQKCDDCKKKLGGHMDTSSSKQRSKGIILRKVEVTLFVINMSNRTECQGSLAVFTKPQHASICVRSNRSFWLIIRNN